jgi:hypothetical protein
MVGDIEMSKEFEEFLSNDPIPLKSTMVALA